MLTLILLWCVLCEFGGGWDFSQKVGGVWKSSNGKGLSAGFYVAPEKVGGGTGFYLVRKMAETVQKREKTLVNVNINSAKAALKLQDAYFIRFSHFLSVTKDFFKEAKRRSNSRKRHEYACKIDFSEACKSSDINGF